MHANQIFIFYQKTVEDVINFNVIVKGFPLVGSNIVMRYIVRYNYGSLSKKFLTYAW